MINLNNTPIMKRNSSFPKKTILRKKNFCFCFNFQKRELKKKNFDFLKISQQYQNIEG